MGDPQGRGMGCFGVADQTNRGGLARRSLYFFSSLTHEGDRWGLLLRVDLRADWCSPLDAALCLCLSVCGQPESFFFVSALSSSPVLFLVGFIFILFFCCFCISAEVGQKGGWWAVV